MTSINILLLRDLKKADQWRNQKDSGQILFDPKEKYGKIG